jgi:hypothetical protein
MLEDAYLLRGLDALCRAHETDYFADGHRGAAIIAATFFCREVELEPGTENVIRAMIDDHWTRSALCTPFPDEPCRPERISRIAEKIRASMTGLRQAGHNVILPTMALRAFRQLPEAVTPARVDGICSLIEAFTSVEALHLDQNDDIPDLGAPSDAADFILAEWAEAISRFDGRGQGWSGHLLTYSRALLDLRRLGHSALARHGERGLKIYIKRIRMGPQKTDVPRPERLSSDLLPHHRAYWQARRAQAIGLGHVFKYPYGFYEWIRLARDPCLQQQCMRVAHHIL